MFKVLFVCTGNICRSPTAHGVFAQMIENKGLEEKVGVDSAGIISYHQGQSPDDRAVRTALKNGVDIRNLRARQVTESDFSNFDLIVAMAEDHYEALSVMKERFHRASATLCKMMDFAPTYHTNDVPDPYYGSGDGFQRVFEMVQTACEGLLAQIERDILNASC